MEVYTIQIAKWRWLKNVDIELVDTTVKSGKGSPFAPNWEMVKRFKEGTLSAQDYEVEYYRLLRHSFHQRREYWLDFLRKQKVAVACYCAPGEFCHRHLLVNYLERCCKHFSLPFTRQGEILQPFGEGDPDAQ